MDKKTDKNAFLKLYNKTAGAVFMNAVIRYAPKVKQVVKSQIEKGKKITWDDTREYVTDAYTRELAERFVRTVGLLIITKGRYKKR